jgi:hypothetical protein
MAKGSEQLTWKQLGGPKPCTTCGAALTLKQVRDVGWSEARGFRVTCVECWERRHGR